MSEVIKLLDLVWENCNAATAHSWERVNHSMQAAIKIAIGSGFTWKPGDFAAVAGKYNAGYWLDGERMYSIAVASENLTACKSIEAYKKREAFIADDVAIESYDSFTHGSSMNRQKDRLAVGSKFPWRGERVEVTSFAVDGSYLTACSYKPDPKGGYSRNIAKRFKITREDIFAERAERKERAELIARLTAAATENGNAEAITKALGAKTKLQLASVPLVKIRTVADKYAPKPPKGTVPVITKAHRSAALAAGACRNSLRPYPVGTPLTALGPNEIYWVRQNLPELYTKYFAKAGAA